MTDSQPRLSKHIALHQGVSRREADELIAGGRVMVDGQTASLGARLPSTDALITIDGTPLAAAAHRTILLHKPADYVCSRRQQGDTPTIYSLLPAELHTLKPVGRLDRDSSGLILLTNDGDFAHRMTHPSFHKTKLYEVTLDHPLQPLHQQMISDYGIMLEDGKSQFVIERAEEPLSAPLSQGDVPARASQTPQDDGTSPVEWPREKDGADSGERNRTEASPSYKITMHEGRNRQIRRTFAALGYTVTTLHRTHFGPYALGDISAGSWQDVDIR